MADDLRDSKIHWIIKGEACCKEVPWFRGILSLSIDNFSMITCSTCRKLALASLEEEVKQLDRLRVERMWKDASSKRPN